MKSLLAILVVVAMLLVGCGQSDNDRRGSAVFTGEVSACSFGECNTTTTYPAPEISIIGNKTFTYYPNPITCTLNGLCYSGGSAPRCTVSIGNECRSCTIAESLEGRGISWNGTIAVGGGGDAYSYEN